MYCFTISLAAMPLNAAKLMKSNDTLSLFFIKNAQIYLICAPIGFLSPFVWVRYTFADPNLRYISSLTGT